MKKSLIFLSLCLITISFVLAGCNQKKVVSNSPELNQANNQIAASPAEKIAPVIVVPEGVYKECPAIYFAKEENGALKDCEAYGGGRVCSYYKETKNGQEKIKNLEYLSECHACRFYGQSGRVDTGTAQVELLGLEKKECSQGMYQE